MKKVLSLVSLLAVLAFAGKASAAPLFPSGVTYSSGISYSSLLANGWTQVVNQPYANSTSFSDTQSWLSQYAGEEIFVGAVDSNGNVYVGATGLVDEVLQQTFSSTIASSYSSSNLYWYNVSGMSFGFTPTQSIFLTSADTNGTGLFGGSSDDGLNDLRLSWHDGNGGWRAGSQLWLNSSTAYNKVVLVAPKSSSVPDAAGTALLGLLALGALAGFRRFQRR